MAGVDVSTLLPPAKRNYSRLASLPHGAVIADNGRQYLSVIRSQGHGINPGSVIIPVRVFKLELDQRNSVRCLGLRQHP